MRAKQRRGVLVIEELGLNRVCGGCYGGQSGPRAINVPAATAANMSAFLARDVSMAGNVGHRREGSGRRDDGVVKPR